uniref:Uncharacterized protein n=1 Tax=Meloidogyne javanica TaxID=6303 RepID=A0A915LH82_MELJA
DDTAAIWDTSQKRWYNSIFLLGIAIRQHLHIVGKHVDSVHCLAWNCSSDLLASGDMSGRVVCTRIEDCQSTSEQQQIFEHIRWLLWHPSANGILFAGSGDGSIWMWLVILNEANCLNVQQFKNAVCVSEVNLPGSCTGAMDLHLSGNMAAFDEAVVDCFWNINSVNASSISLSSICVDGTIRNWDSKNGNLIGKIDGGGDQIYSAIKLKNNDGIERILTGCEGGLIRIFELSF